MFVFFFLNRNKVKLNTSVVHDYMKRVVLKRNVMCTRQKVIMSDLQNVGNAAQLYNNNWFCICIWLRFVLMGITIYYF